MNRTVPPSGHVAGAYAYTDNTSGVQKPPANVELQFIADVQLAVPGPQQGFLNAAGINCIRSFPGRGIRVWGARRSLSQDPDWKYIHRRRLMSMIEDSVDHAMRWVVFQKNDADLQRMVTHSLSVFLQTIWLSGGLQGARPSEGYFVKCDNTNNTPSTHQRRPVCLPDRCGHRGTDGVSRFRNAALGSRGAGSGGVAMGALRIDPLGAYNFYLTLLDSHATVGTLITVALNYFVAGFSECSGIEASFEVMDLKEGGLNSHVWKLPVRASHSNITLKHGAIYAYDDLWDWHYGWVQGKGTRKDGLIVLKDNSGRPAQDMEVQARDSDEVVWPGAECVAKQCGD